MAKMNAKVSPAATVKPNKKPLNKVKKPKAGATVVQSPPAETKKKLKKIVPVKNAPAVPTKLAPVDSSDGSDQEEAEKSTVTVVAPKPKRDSVSVFVGNLPGTIKRQRLVKLFEPFGAVLSIRIRKSNGSRLFKKKSVVGPSSLIAFVDYATKAEANASLSLNGSKVGDHQIRVDLQTNSKSAANGEPNAFDAKRTVFVGNLKYSATEQLLTNAFKSCGAIEYVRALQSEKGCKGIAYVCFKDNASVTKALELNNSVLEGREMRVERYTAGKQGTDTKASAGGAKQRRPAEQKVVAKKTSESAGVKTDTKKGKGKPSKGALSGPKLLAKKITPRPAKVTA